MIFGVDAPKLIYNKGIAGEKTVLIDYCVISKLEPETKFIEHESELDANRYCYKLGTHLDVEITMNLFKYGNPASKFDEIYTYLGKKVTFYLHRDKEPYKQANGTDALFMLKEAKNFYLESTDIRGGKKDGLLLTFQSLTPISLLLGVDIVTQPNEIIINEDNII